MVQEFIGGCSPKYSSDGEDGKKTYKTLTVKIHQEDKIKQSALSSPSWADPWGGGGRGSGLPLKNRKNIGFLSNTSPDRLKNHKLPSRA